jgi:hypothetical protein
MEIVTPCSSETEERTASIFMAKNYAGQTNK